MTSFQSAERASFTTRTDAATTDARPTARTRSVPLRRERDQKGLLRVLVAEDDFEMRRMVGVALRRDGHVVIEVKSGWEMLSALGSELLNPTGRLPVDLIVSDFRMPGVTGLSVLAGLRELDWRTPFILITAFGDPEVRDRALRDGASAFFEKPFDLDDLRQKVRELAEAGEVRDLNGLRCSACGGWTRVGLAGARVCLGCVQNQHEMGGEG